MWRATVPPSWPTVLEEHRPQLVRGHERRWEPPLSYYKERTFGRFTADDTGLRNIDAAGEDNVCFEVDYPHTDTSWPNTRPFIEHFRQYLTDEQLYKVLRGNAIRMLGLGRA